FPNPANLIAKTAGSETGACGHRVAGKGDGMGFMAAVSIGLAIGPAGNRRCPVRSSAEEQIECHRSGTEANEKVFSRNDIRIMFS
ncbi:hypothetical protein, partial [Rhizobium sp. Pop5]|uniref:hypothetical protein n=1 Tax=Rhizobium sp. Pop5 TaxID=1223565 RepID=UPI001969E269